MSGRETNIATQKAAVGNHNNRRQHRPDSLEPVHTSRDLVDSNTYWIGSFRCDGRTANLAQQVLVEVDKMNKKKRNGMTGKKAGRPSSSSDVRLTPHFNNPIDVERLGKALVAVALKKTVQLDTSDVNGDGDNSSGGNHAET